MTSRILIALLTLSPLVMASDMPGGRSIKTNDTSAETATGRNVTATAGSGSKYGLDVNIIGNSGGGASSVSVANFPATQPVSGPITDTQIRATPLPISGTVSISGGGDASAANQSTGNTSLSSIDTKTPALGQALAAGSTPVVLTAAQLSTLTPLASVSVSSAPTTAVTGTFWQSTQPVSVADGSNVTLGTKTDAKSTSTDGTSTSIVSILKEISAMEQAPASRAVTNAGTFATQSTLAAETTKVIGTVNVAASQTIGISAGSAVIGHTINDSGSTTAVTGNVAGTIADGASVTLGAKADAKSTATDTTAVTVMSVLKQISASVQAPPSQAVTQATGTNLHAVLDTTSTTAVTQATGTNLHAVLDTTSTTAVTQATGTNLHAVIDSGSTTAVTGTVTVTQATTGGNPCTNPGATLVSITGATSTNNATQIIALSGSTKIYICALTVVGVSGTTPTFSIVQGTGSNCVTGQTTVVQAFATTANQSYLFAGPVAVGTAGAAFCYKDGGTSPVENYQITYVQQ